MDGLVLFVGALALSAGTLSAQSAYEIPRVVRIHRDEVRQGRRAEYDRHAATLVHAYTRVKFPLYYIALSSVSGLDEFWTIEHFAAFAGIQETDEMLSAAPMLNTEIANLNATGGELRVNRQTWLGLFRPELSYRTDVISSNMSKYRYMTVGTIHVRPGRDRDFAELARLLVQNYSRARDERPYMVYQIISGTQTGTYVVLAPLTSLANYDEAPDRSRALRDVVGEENMREVNRRTAECIDSTDSDLFEIRLDLSYRMTASARQE